MITDLEALRARISFALEGEKIDATQLAREIGRGPDYIRDFLRGRKKSLAVKELRKMEEVLSVGAGFFTKEENWNVSGAEEITKKSLNALRRNAGLSNDPIDLIGEEDPNYIYIYHPSKIVSSEMVVGSSPYDRVPRPWFLKLFRWCYGLLLMDDTMAPAYEAGDIIIINPNLPLTSGDDFLFCSNVEAGEYKAIVRRLSAWTHDAWQVTQFDLLERPRLSRETWPRAYRIVATISS